MFKLAEVFPFSYNDSFLSVSFALHTVIITTDHFPRLFVYTHHEFFLQHWDFDQNERIAVLSGLLVGYPISPWHLTNNRAFM